MALIKPEQLRSGFYEITGSLFGTSSYANFALTASYALSSPTPFRISTGSISASVDVGPNIFIIINNNQPVLAVGSRGCMRYRYRRYPKHKLLQPSSRLVHPSAELVG